MNRKVFSIILIGFLYQYALGQISEGGTPLSPNPTDGMLYIEIDADAAQAMLLTAGKSSLTFDVRLYDGQGNLLLQQKTKGGTVEFNVSSLPGGYYYLHVYDGVSSTPLMQQVVVEH